ncbi:MAG: YHS domain-containing protein [Chthonomonadales bacterium]
MTKSLLIAGALAVLGISALAGPNKGKAKKAPEPATIKCAVMTGRDVNIKAATAHHLYADYKGRRYFFCCGACPTAFKQDPAKYAKNASIPTPKGAKSGSSKS